MDSVGADQAAASSQSGPPTESDRKRRRSGSSSASDRQRGVKHGRRGVDRELWDSLQFTVLCTNARPEGGQVALLPQAFSAAVRAIVGQDCRFAHRFRPASGAIVIKVDSEEARDRLLQQTALRNREVKMMVPSPPPPRRVRGVIHNVPADVPAEDITTELAEQGVIATEKYGPYTAVLEFASARPNRVKLWSWYRVFQYIEKQKPCFKCFAYDHPTGRCRKAFKCLRCGEPGHLIKDCVFSQDNAEAWQCGSCQGAHRSGARTCPVRQQAEKAQLSAVRQARRHGRQPLRFVWTLL